MTKYVQQNRLWWQWKYSFFKIGFGLENNLIGLIWHKMNDFSGILSKLMIDLFRFTDSLLSL